MREQKKRNAAPLLRLALAGNPNCGKTTLFNRLTGSNQQVGNWPGVTVARKEGRTLSGKSLLIDLPGLYSLSPCSAEEEIARDYLLRESPGAIINIVDGTNLERNLYLTVQLLELEIPLVVAVNMADVLAAKGWRLDCPALSRELGVPVIPVSARRGEHTAALLEAAEQAALGPAPSPISYPGAVGNALAAISRFPAGQTAKIPRAYLAAGLLEGDPLASSLADKELVHRAEEIARDLEETGGPGDRETLLADARYQFLEGAVSRCLEKRGEKRTLTQRIDQVAVGRFSALPLFLLVLSAIFTFTFGPVGQFFSRAVALFFEKLLSPALSGLLEKFSAPGWCKSLLLEGVLGGVSGVLVFLPQIALLFFCLTLLEDSGYMARAAFLMDRLLRRLGLSGKACIPLLMGFGCTTPALMATRTLENQTDRRLTMMLTPFMSCGAKLPVYALFAGIFFPRHQGMVVCGLYLLGAVVALLTGGLLRRTLFRGECPAFVLELPPYRMPQLSSVLLRVWERCQSFLIKAGTLLFSMSVIVWVLQSFSLTVSQGIPSLCPADSPAQSILGQLGAEIAPLLAPLGFGNWQAAVALLTGLISKESVVGTLTILYGGGDSALLPKTLAAAFEPAAALAFLVFSLLYTPCISALATLKKEMNSLRWTAGTAALSTAAAWVLAFLTFRLGKLFLPGGAAAPVLAPQRYPLRGEGNPGAALLCGALILLAVWLLAGQIRRRLRGDCCRGCAGCPGESGCFLKEAKENPGKSGKTAGHKG